MSSLNVVVFGAGRRGTAHTEAVGNLESDAQVLGVSDVDERRAQALVNESAPHARASSDSLSLLDEFKPDIVYITTPPEFHLEQTIAALESGAHVILEKPITLDIEGAESIVEAAKRHNRIVHVCHQQRYNPGIMEVREILKGQRIALTNIWNYRMAPDILGNWNRAWGGGHVVEWGIHYLDLCRYIMGSEATEVHARYADVVMRGRENWDNWDAYTMNVQWDNGAVGGYASTYALKPGIKSTAGLSIIAEEGRVEIGAGGCHWITPDETQTWDGKGVNSNVELARAMFSAVRNGNPDEIRQSLDDAMSTHRLVIAANESAITNQPVALSGHHLGSSVS
jgi:predicted dehydrogenase